VRDLQAAILRQAPELAAWPRRSGRAPSIDFPMLVKSIRLDLDTLADYLDEAADERIVVTSHSGGGYAFARGLLREQLLASMPALRRQLLHAKVKGHEMTMIDIA
jgi:hypothetical protein